MPTITVTVKILSPKVPGHPGSMAYKVTHKIHINYAVSKICQNRRGPDSSHDAAYTKLTFGQNDIANSVIRHIEQYFMTADTMPNNRDSDLLCTHNDVRRANQIHTRPNSTLSLFAFMTEIIDSFRRHNRLGTAHNYRAACLSFMRYRNGSDICFGEIDREIMEGYQTYLKSTGLSRNTISFYMRILRAVYNRATDRGLTIDRRPFQNVFTGSEKTPKRAIPAIDIKRIHNLDLSRQPHLEFARDIFMFLFYCRGMSFVDAVYLRKSDIKNGTLTYCRHKTGQQLQVKIINRIGDIIDRYSASRSEYIFPIITKSGHNERQQYETGLRIVNRNLKTVGEMAGLSTRLTTYVARHSWATIAKSKNVPLSVISDALGHDSSNTTQIYLASVNSTEIDNVNELIVAEI